MYSHLKERSYYEDLYDRNTVRRARENLRHFTAFYDKWFEIMPDEKPNSLRSSFHLNHIYMLFVGNELLDRYDKREGYIQNMMRDDEAKDEQITNARLQHEPVCEHCGKTELRIIDKTLLQRSNEFKHDNLDEVLFMLKCTICHKNSAFWEDGSKWEKHKTFCPKCDAVMTEKDSRKGKVLTTTYTCPECAHTHKDRIDLTPKKEKPDVDYEKDRSIFCFHDKKKLEEHRDAKRRYEGLAQLFKEHKEKEANKHIYDAVASLQKLKIIELSDLLTPALKEAAYVEFSLDKPEIGKDVIIGFSCLDSKSDREDYDSRKALKKAVQSALANTNWRLTSDGISYRLGYLSGRLKAYENEDDLKKLVMKDNKLQRLKVQ